MADDESQVPPPSPPPSEQPSTAPPPPLGPVPQEQRPMGMLCHLLALAGYVIPFGNIIGPLIVWMVKKDEMPFVDDQGKEALNFQITMTIIAIICAVTVCVGIGVVLLPIVGIVNIVFIIIASIKANEGAAYRYPFNIRMIK